MTTLQASIAEQKRNGIAGKFGAKTSTAPLSSLRPEPERHTPESVQRPSFSAEALIKQLTPSEDDDFHLNQNFEIVSLGGESVALRYDRVNPYREGDVTPIRIDFDDNGNIARQVEWVDHAEAWVEYDTTASEAGWNQFCINMARLKAMGANAGNVTNDGGYTGYLVTGANHEAGARMSNAEVAKAARQQLKEAKKWGAVPAEYEYRVSSSKHSVSATIEGMPDEKLYKERIAGFPQGMSDHAKTVQDTVDAVINQWNVRDVDSQIDYFHVRYYSHVRIEDESQAKFRAEQRELAKRKREARKAAAA